MSGKIRILIVEDDLELLNLFRMALSVRATDFEIVTATSSGSAVSLARDLLPDLILLDIMLPGDIDGIEICRQLHFDPATRGVGVVMVSALDDPTTHRSAIEAGAIDYWAKPISIRGLQDRVRNVLKLKHGSEVNPATGFVTERAKTTTTAPATKNRPGLDNILAALQKTLAELEPEDWKEILALAEARLAYRQRAKAGNDLSKSNTIHASPRSS
jgi:DNA-binding response OmpR family regulator